MSPRTLKAGYLLALQHNMVALSGICEVQKSVMFQEVTLHCFYHEFYFYQTNYQHY